MRVQNTLSRKKTNIIKPAKGKQMGTLPFKSRI